MSITAAPAHSSPVTVPELATFEDFLAWARGVDSRAEWVDGEVVVMTPASVEHQMLVGFLYRLLAAVVDEHELGTVLPAPVALKLSSRPSGREPDLLFVSAAHADRLKETHVDGPADLVVEVVSPDSDARDHGDKFVEYEAAGIEEYWLIDPLRRAATFYRLTPEGRYGAVTLTADGLYESPLLPGLRLRPAWLWQRPLPPLATVMTGANT
jgi:Uma2 family endonuclease